MLQHIRVWLITLEDILQKSSGIYINVCVCVSGWVIVCSYICIYIYTYIYIHKYMYPYAHAHMYINIHIYVSTRTHTHTGHWGDLR